MVWLLFDWWCNDMTMFIVCRQSSHHQCRLIDRCEWPGSTMQLQRQRASTGANVSGVSYFLLPSCVFYIPHKSSAEIRRKPIQIQCFAWLDALANKGSVQVQAWKDITSRIEDAMRKLENESPCNKCQLPTVQKEGESLTEVAPKLPGRPDSPWHLCMTA